MDPLDRAVGALLGLACRRRRGHDARVPARRARSSRSPTWSAAGRSGLKAGEWTDDTSMALCLAESLLDRGTLDLEDQLRRYVLWHDTGYLSSNGRCFDIGITTRTPARSVPTDRRSDRPAARRGVGRQRLADASRARCPSAGTPTPRRRRARPASRAAQRTRRARPVDACRLMGAMVARAHRRRVIRRGGRADVLAVGRPAPRGRGHRRRRRGETRQPPAIRGTGYCIDALEAALWSVAGADDFRDAVLRAANLGDDADTTAAIAGQLAGARWGASGIPAAWREKVVAGERIVVAGPWLVRRRRRRRSTSRVAARRLRARLVGGAGTTPRRASTPVTPTRRGLATRSTCSSTPGVRTFVDLTTPADRLDPYEPLVAEVAEARRLDVRHESRSRSPTSASSTTTGTTKSSQTIERRRSREAACTSTAGAASVEPAPSSAAFSPTKVLDYDEIIERLALLRRGTRRKTARHRRCVSNTI